MALDLRVRKDPMAPASPSSSDGDSESRGSDSPNKLSLSISGQPPLLGPLPLPISTSDLVLPTHLSPALYPPAVAAAAMSSLGVPGFSMAPPSFAASASKLLDSMASHQSSSSLSPEAAAAAAAAAAAVAAAGDLQLAQELAVQRELTRLKDDWTRCRVDSAKTSPTSTHKPKKYDGSRGVGWTTIGDVIVPYIMRGPSKYVSVRVVETKLLSTLQGVDLDKMSHAGPLYSYYITEQEARLFTEINARCYNHQFGIKPFTTQDLIVSLAEFERFYHNLRKQCGIFGHKPQVSPTGPAGRGRRKDKDSCNISTPPLLQDINDTSLEGVEGGWVQINNTVIPYVFRNGVKFVPLSVIKYAAGLLTDVRIDGYKTPCTEMEYKYMNNSCKSIGVEFEFTKATNFIKLELVIRMSNCKVTIKELPKDNPFNQAVYQPHVRENMIVFPLSSSPELAPNQNPAVFQIPSTSLSTAQDTFASMFPPVTAIATHALQFFNASNTSVPPSLSALGQDILNNGSEALHGENGRGRSPFSAPSVPVKSPISSLSPPSTLTVGGQILANPTKKLPTFTKSKPTKAATTSKNMVKAPLATIPSTGNLGHPNKIVIECVDFHEKTLPCLQRGGVPENSYVLVESVMRLYFPQTTLEQFIDILQGVMDVTIIKLKSVEEQAFIRFYNLPVKAMRYKFMMLFADLQRCFSDLRTYFNTGYLKKPSHSNDYTHSEASVTQSMTRSHSTSPVPTNNNGTLLYDQKVKSEGIKDSVVEAGESPVCFVLDNNTVVKENPPEEILEDEKCHLGTNEDKSTVNDSECESQHHKEECGLQEERQAMMFGYDEEDGKNAEEVSINEEGNGPLLCKGAKGLRDSSSPSSSSENSHDDGNQGNDDQGMSPIAKPSLMIEELGDVLQEESQHCLDNSSDKECLDSDMPRSESKEADTASNSKETNGNLQDGVEKIDLESNESDQSVKCTVDVNCDTQTNGSNENDSNGAKDDIDDVQTEDLNGRISPVSRKRKDTASGDENSPPVPEKKVKASGNLLNKLESALEKLKKKQKEKLNSDQV